jgi:hypothetical protein
MLPVKVGWNISPFSYLAHRKGFTKKTVTGIIVPQSRIQSVERAF